MGEVEWSGRGGGGLVEELVEALVEEWRRSWRVRWWGNCPANDGVSWRMTGRGWVGVCDMQQIDK